MIPKKNYYILAGVGPVITKNIFLAHHSQVDWNIFMEFMRGQTCTSVGNEMAIYSWDYERWLREGKKTSQGENWD